MTRSQPRSYWRLIAIASRFGVLSSALIAFVICALVTCSLVFHNELLLFTIPRTMANEIHVMFKGGQLQIGTQIEVSSISDWVRHVRAGEDVFGDPVTGTFDCHYGPFQLSWIRFAGSDPDFGFACPVVAILVELAILVWVANRVGQYALRRAKPVEEDGEAMPFHADA